MTRSCLPALSVALAAVLAGCTDKPNKQAGADAALATAPTSSVMTAKESPGDAAHGKELVLTFQCNRCHDGTGHPPAAQNKHCVHCHADIVEGRFSAPPASIAKWKPRVKELADAPSLEATGARFTRTWIEQYLVSPHDLRPNLHQDMPRLPISLADARDIAAYLSREAAPASAPPPELAKADVAKGRRLLDTKGCGSCHAMTGVSPLEASAVNLHPKTFARGRRLAPDLRLTRERMPPAALVAWLEDPERVKPDTAMPRMGLTRAEAIDLAGYILTAELAPPAPKKKIERLPVLARKVTFKEVDEKVFHRTCWHCHSEPDYAIGDGGPGNSGGFGFKPRGLNLSDYNNIAAGYVDDKGERASVFARGEGDVPRLVLALVARHEEVAGESGPVRGMPLGYDPVSLEDIQLVETWIAQGRPR